MKTLWLTAIGSSEDIVKNTIGKLQQYGLVVKGHFWEDDLEKVAWSKPRDELLKPEVTLWLILTSAENFSKPSIQYGLSLLSMMLYAQRGLSFPIVILLTQGEAPSSETLPTLLKGIDFMSQSDPALGAKMVAKVHSPVKQIDSEYRIDVYANPQIGQWLEIGPKNISWNGAMFGVSDAKISYHAVGPKGSLPDKAVLNYPVKDMKVTLGEKEYIVWAVQNEVNTETSYFIKVEGFPESIIFGPYSSDEQAEVYVIRFK
jgi:hypothetical protein